MSRSGLTHPRRDMHFSNENVQRDPGEYRFLGGILAEIRGGNFSREGSRWENGPPRQDPGERRESWRDPGEIPVPILQGLSQNFLIIIRNKKT